MRNRFVAAVMFAMMLSVVLPKPVRAAGYSQTLCDMSGGQTCSLSYELWSMVTCYGNGFLCYRAW